MSRLPESFIKNILSSTNIVELVGDHVQLRKNGPNYHGLCPFHDEKTSSFTVSEPKQFFHCFGCKAHGDAFKFLMMHQHMTFFEAVKHLSEKAGIPMPEQETEKSAPKINQSLFRAMEMATNYYRESLLLSAEGIAYLQSRDISPACAIRFKLGYARDEWQNLACVFPDYIGQELLDCGLTAKGAADRIYDRFRRRLMIPVISQKGQVIAFGGRAIVDDKIKYLNSPDTQLFDKGSELFGIPQASESIRSLGFVVCVEGFFDVISLSDRKVENVLAVMGSAPTSTHIRRMFRMTERIIFCFDGDAAGLGAAWKALGVALPELTDRRVVSYVFLPEKEDPDSFVRKFGAGAFYDLCKKSKPLSSYLSERLEKDFLDGSVEGKARFMSEVKPYIDMMNKDKAPMLRIQLLKTVGNCVGMSLDEMSSIFNSGSDK